MADATPIYYASLAQIRMKAGFDGATNLDDKYVKAARQDAQDEINSVLGGHFTVPFNPVPERIRTLTIKLAAYTLRNDWINDIGSQKALEALRKQLAGMVVGDESITDENGVDLSTSEGVSFDFGDEPRMFRVGQEF